MIREVEVSDYKDIWLLNGQLGYEYPIENTRSKLEKIVNEVKDKVFVGVIGNKVVGYIHVQPYELLYYDSIVNVLGLVVDHGYRRKGIGRELLNYTEKWLKNNKYRGIRLVSGAEREDAHKFYISCGFRDKKNQKNFIKLF